MTQLLRACPCAVDCNGFSVGRDWGRQPAAQAADASFLKVRGRWSVEPSKGPIHLWTVRPCSTLSSVPLPLLQPMLATSGQPGGDQGQWSFETKWDGWRALVYLDEGLKVRTRTGRQVSDCLP